LNTDGFSPGRYGAYVYRRENEEVSALINRQ
jgi:hypothetical protein